MNIEMIKKFRWALIALGLVVFSNGVFDLLLANDLVNEVMEIKKTIITMAAGMFMIVLMASPNGYDD